MINTYQMPLLEKGEDDVHFMTSKRPSAATASTSDSFKGLHNDIMYQVMDLLPARDLISFGQVNHYSRALVTKQSSTLTRNIVKRETERLQEAMRISKMATYDGLALDEALRVWCEYWGRPHHAYCREAGSHFGCDFDDAYVFQTRICLPFGWRRQFWGRLAEFLLHVSDLVIFGHERCEEGNIRSDWIATRAYDSFHDAATCGAAFLTEVLGITSNLSFHYCLRRMISGEEWLKMVRAVREEPIVRYEISKLTQRITNREELWDAVATGMGYQPSISSFSQFEYFQTTILELPNCPAGFHYLPIPADEAQGNDGAHRALSSVEGIRSTQAAKLAWKICDVRGKEKYCTICFQQLLRAAMLEALDVSDSPSSSDNRWLEESDWTDWTNRTEPYGEVAIRMRYRRRKGSSSDGRNIPNTRTSARSVEVEIDDGDECG